MTNTKKTHKTHADLLPKDACPALLFKHLLTGSLDDVVYDDRQWPGDGYFWCGNTCQCVGPDDELVHPKDCQPGRGCYDGPRA
ncbi:MAG: hypothetical protein KDE27_20585 [Planctomycetes bacterium]|nr:hypothetical protein [Planctomycetota bacterium]